MLFEDYRPRFVDHSLHLLAAGGLAERGGPQGAAPLIEAFDYIAPAEARARVLSELRALWFEHARTAELPAPPTESLVTERHGLDLARIAPLIDLRLSKDISIGE